MKIDTTEEEVNVTRRHESIIVDVLSLWFVIFKDMFWLHTDWIENDDKDRHKAKSGVINEINLIPSRPSSLVVKIL